MRVSWRLELVLLFWLAGSLGCETSYVVQQTYLDRLAVQSPRDAVVPARREDGARVLLRTDTLPAEIIPTGPSAQWLDTPAAHLSRADELQRTGDFKRSAAELRDCVRLLGDVVHEDERVEVQAAIRALDDGAGAKVSIRTLRLAPRLGAPPPRPSTNVTVHPRSPMATAVILAALGGLFTVGGVVMGIALPSLGGDGTGGLGAMVGGTLAGASGLGLIIGSAIVASRARKHVEADASYAPSRSPRRQ